MCSSRVDRERGCVVITVTSGEPGYEAGRTFWPVGTYQPGGPDRSGDYLAGLVLSRQNGHPWGEGLRVKPPEGGCSSLRRTGPSTRRSSRNRGGPPNVARR